MAVDGADFTGFVSEHQRGMLRLATALTGNPVHAEDIVADVLARAYEKWDRILQMDGPPRTCRGWSSTSS